MTNRTAVEPVLPAWIEHAAHGHICDECGRRHVGSDLISVWIRGETVDEPMPAADRPQVGKTWSQRQVESIYENPVYCGYGLGSRMSQGIYYRRGAEGPEEIELPKEVLANCRTVPKQYRPPNEWVWQEQPLMMDFLPERLREKALAEIKKVLIHRYCSVRSVLSPACR